MEQFGAEKNIRKKSSGINFLETINKDEEKEKQV